MHARYLKMGGVDGFIGDGALTQANENMTEIFYSRHIASLSIYRSTISASGTPGTTLSAVP